MRERNSRLPADTSFATLPLAPHRPAGGTVETKTAAGVLHLGRFISMMHAACRRCDSLSVKPATVFWLQLPRRSPCLRHATPSAAQASGRRIEARLAMHTGCQGSGTSMRPQGFGDPIRAIIILAGPFHIPDGKGPFPVTSLHRCAIIPKAAHAAGPRTNPQACRPLACLARRAFQRLCCPQRTPAPYPGRRQDSRPGTPYLNTHRDSPADQHRRYVPYPADVWR